MSLRFSRLGALLSCLTLGACGGGGGSGGAPANGPPAVNNPPPPPPPPLVLSTANAVEAARTLLHPLEQTYAFVELPLITAEVLTAVGQTSFSLDCLAPPVIGAVHLSYTDRDGNGSISNGDTLAADHELCGGVARDMTMSVSFIDVAARRLEGRVEYQAVTEDGIRTEGSFTLVSLFDPAAATLDQTLDDLEINVPSGASVRIRNAVAERRLPNGSDYDFTFSGRVSSESLGGDYEFETLVPLAGVTGAPPTAGELLLRASGSGVRIVPAADPELVDAYFEYQIDADGAGQYGAAQRERWAEIVRGPIFGWDGNSAPRVTDFTIAPENPMVDESVVVSYSAWDPDDDPLTFSGSWLVNESFLSQTGQELPLASFSKGDVVTFHLVVDDGRRTVVRRVSVTIANTPPQVTATLEPDAPRTADDLVLRHGVADRDGDHLEVSFEWLRNGQPITDETTHVLPHTQHAKSDVITGIVHVSDGEAVATASASVTIEDTPPVLSLLSEPSEVPYGETVTFELVASDADGDPTGSFVLTHGPAGMTVNPVTGEVRWPMIGPAFEEGMALAWGVTLDRLGANVVTGSVWLARPQGGDAVYRTGLEAPVHKALAVGDFDGDDVTELLVAGENALYELEWTGSGYRQSWTYPFSFEEHGQRFSTLVTGDVTGDGRHEIFIAYEGRILLLDGVGRKIAGGGGTSRPGFVIRDMELGDVDGDGVIELVAIAVQDGSANPDALAEVHLYRAEFLAHRFHFAHAERGSAIAIGNVDDDPALEIVVNSGYVFDGMTWLPDWHHTGAFGWELATGNVDGDSQGIEEIVASVDGATVQGYSAVTQAALPWSIPSAATGALLVADITGDGTAEVVLGPGAAGGEVQAYGIAPSPTELFSFPAGGGATTAIALGDVDGDAGNELVWGTQLPAGRLTIADIATQSVEWTSVDDAQDTIGPYAGGELARGPANAESLLFATLVTSGGLRVIGMDPETGDVASGANLGDPGNGRAAMTAADYDGDGVDEALIAAANGGEAFHTAYDFFAETAEWTSAVFPSGQNGVAIARGDLTGDGISDFVAIDLDGIARAYAPPSVTPFWTSVALPEGRDVAIAELNAGGLPEIVIAAGDRVIVFSRDGEATFVQTAVSAELIADLRDIEIGDVDGDGQPEIFVLHGSPARVRRFDAALQPQGAFDYWAAASGLLIEQSPYARKNLVLVHALSSDQLVAVDASSGVAIWASPRLLGEITHGSVHFVDANGELRIAVGTSLGMYLTR